MGWRRPGHHAPPKWAHSLVKCSCDSHRVKDSTLHTCNFWGRSEDLRSSGVTQFPLVIGTGGQQTATTVWLFCMRFFFRVHLGKEQWGRLRVSKGMLKPLRAQGSQLWGLGSPQHPRQGALAEITRETPCPCWLPWSGKGMNSAEKGWNRGDCRAVIGGARPGPQTKCLPNLCSLPLPHGIYTLRSRKMKIYNEVQFDVKYSHAISHGPNWEPQWSSHTTGFHTRTSPRTGISRVGNPWRSLSLSLSLSLSHTHTHTHGYITWF